MRRITLTSLAAVLTVVLALAPLAPAQQRAAALDSRASRPSMANSTLAPVAQPPAPAAPGEIPDRQDQAAARLQGLPVGTRDQQRARDDLGRQGHAVRQQPRGRQRLRGGGQGRPARGQDHRQGPQPSPTAWPSRTARSTSPRSRASPRWRESRTSSTTRRRWRCVYDILPRDLPHGWKYLAFGPDGKLYFNIGAPCNICIPPDTHANISRVNPDGTGFEYCGPRRPQQRGVRLAPGDQGALLHHPRPRLARATTSPSDRFDHAPRKGLNFGFPYCHQGDILDPEFGKGRSCSEFVPPLLKTGPHVAGNGVQFYTGSMFPAEYKNRAFLAQRGSWNRTQKIGYRVMMVDPPPAPTCRSTRSSPRDGSRGTSSGAGPCTRSR